MSINKYLKICLPTDVAIIKKIKRNICYKKADKVCGEYSTLIKCYAFSKSIYSSAKFIIMEFH